MALNVSNTSAALSPLLALNGNCWLSPHVLGRSVVKIYGGSSGNRKNTNIASYDGEKKSGQNAPRELEPLWDDGYGTQTIRDYGRISMDLIKNDGGPPRWFCPVACGMPIKDSPVLLYLPGMDGTGAGLVVHEKALGKVFHVRCLHIPVQDRTPFEGLIKMIEETMKAEHSLSPTKPIYLLGDSFGGALALAVAARNLTIDLILIITNPATSYVRSPVVHHLVAFARAFPDEHYDMFLKATSSFLGDFVKMAMVNIDGQKLSPSVGKLIGNLNEDIQLLSGEGCKLFWPDKQEFVRMALKFGATIIPFAVVGEDDISELIIDYDDMKNIPFLDERLNEFNEGRKNLREGMPGEIAKQQLHTPIIVPKLPGRLYFMFGKPIQTKGKENMSNDNDYLQELYSQIKFDIEKNMDYLVSKREGDPYRSIVSRLVWQMNYGDLDQIPSFEP